MSGLRTSFSLYFWDWQMLAVLRKYVWGIFTGYFYFYLHPASFSLTGHWMHRTLSRLTRRWPQHFPVSPVSHLAPCFGQQLQMMCNEYLYNNCRHLWSGVLRIPGFRPLLGNLAPSFLASPWRQCSCHGDFFCFLRSRGRALDTLTPRVSRK